MGIWSNFVNSFSTTGTPIYTMERDNSVANAYNSWLSQENAKMAQAEQAARQAELQAQAQVNQMAMTQAMNEFNMNKYAEQEQAKLDAEKQRAYDEYGSKLLGDIETLTNNMVGLKETDPKYKQLLESLKTKQTQFNTYAPFMSPMLRDYNLQQVQSAEAGSSAYAAQKKQNIESHKKNVELATSELGGIGKSFGAEGQARVNEEAAKRGVKPVWKTNGNVKILEKYE